MPAEEATAVAKEKIWKEHLDKCANQERRQRNEHPPTFSLNPFRVMTHNRPLAEPCNKRDNRFLDRDKAVLGSIMRQLGPDKVRHLMPQTGEEDEHHEGGGRSDGQLTEYSIPQQHHHPTSSSSVVYGGGDSLPPIRGGGVTSTTSASTFGGPHGDASVNKMLAMVSQTPVEKYAFPMTESQELGWMPPRAKGKQDTRFRFGKKNCQETKFAGSQSIAKNFASAK